MKKYLISIDTEQGSRIQSFYQQKCFFSQRQYFTQFGVIGKQLSVATYFDLAVARQLIPLSPGELGCTLSHVAALKDFVQSGELLAVIFEDDVVAPIDLDLDQLARDVIALNLKSAFFLSLGGIEQVINNRVYGKIESDLLYAKRILNVHPASLPRLSGAYAYMLDQRMAQILIQYHTVPRVYDHWEALSQMEPDIHFYATHLFDHPDISEQKEQLSHIEIERLSLNQKRLPRKPLYMKIKNSLIRRWLKFAYHSY